LVNTDRLVQICIRILGLISDKNLSVNEIIRQTSSDRSHVIEAIKKLEGAALVVENKAREHKQKRIKRLSELGREFKHFMADIEKYNEAFIRFEKSREENFDTLEKSEIQTNSGILRNRGWTEEEVRLREKTWDGIYMMRGIFEKNIFNALVSRYSVLAAEIGDNEVAKDILAKIVTDEVAHQLLIIQRYYQKSVVGALVRNLAFTTVDDLKEFYQSWFANYSLLNLL
jgi:DNA-binding transcriptional regulator GbsR (MarR family)